VTGAERGTAAGMVTIGTEDEEIGTEDERGMTEEKSGTIADEAEAEKRGGLDLETVMKNVNHAACREALSGYQRHLIYRQKKGMREQCSACS